MARDLGRLRLEKLIIHEIPRRTASSNQQPLLSQIESPLTQDNKNYFQQKITRSLTSAAYSVVFDDGSTSPIPGLVLNSLGSQNDNFIDVSIEIAKHLHNCQTRVNPAGLVTVVQASIEEVKALAILKLEKEQGVRMNQELHKGKMTFNIEHIPDLMLTDSTKVFKVGLFVQEGSTLESIEGVVSDKQRSYRPETEVADFFLKKFLGCKLREEAEVTTKRFYQVSQDFFNQKVVESDAKAHCEIALIAALKSQDSKLHPETFAEENLSVGYRQQYIDFLASHQVGTQQFDKDTTLIESQLKRVKINFESGLAILISGTSEVLENQVRVVPLENDQTRVEVEGRLKSLQ